jgi:hypothetical protein
MRAQFGERLLEIDGLSRLHLLDALAQGLVQFGALLIVEVVPRRSPKWISGATSIGRPRLPVSSFLKICFSEWDAHRSTGEYRR